MCQWFKSFINQTVLDEKTSRERAFAPLDPRTMLYSCCDLGGTDNGDDWTFQLSGGGGKFSPVGLQVARSVMGGTRRTGSLEFRICQNGVARSQWDCMECVYATTDRLIMCAPYWGRKDIGFAIEFMMVNSGTCVVSMGWINRSKDPIQIDLAGIFLDSELNRHELSDSCEVANEDFCLRFANDGESSFKIPPGEYGAYSCRISLAQDVQKCNSRIEQAGMIDLNKFRETQNRLANPAAFNTFREGEERMLAKAIHNVMRMNILNNGKECFSAPNRIIHKGQWLWDTCFHAIAWKLFDRELAKQLLLNLFNYQDKQSGFIPICVEQTYGLQDYATQPPLIAFALRKVCDDPDTIAWVYPRLEQFYRWLEQHRMQSGGLFRWNTAGESGMDNSPRFDNDPTLPTTPETLNFCTRVIPDNIAHIDISCMMVMFAESLEEFARKLGQDDQAKLWKEKTGQLTGKINECLFDAKDGFYYDRSEDGAFRRIKTVASFWALLAGVCSKEQAHMLMEHIMNPAEFFTEFPLPSVAVNEPSFCLNYWRGPVWINICYIVVLGLRKYGYNQQADEIVRKVTKGICRDYYRTGQFWELYDPFGGPSEYLRKKHMGPRGNASGFCGWTANILNMIDEATVNK
jgi:hypothetical protein